MTDVWKSVPKKFCEICKCWYYDNKISIQHHEQGQRHQQNVKNRIKQIGAKGRQQEHEAREKYNALMQMERGAMQAYKRDVSGNATTKAAYNLSGNSTSGAASAAKRPRISADMNDFPSTSSLASVVWLEAKTTDEETGESTSYYWNMQTGETVWELPAGASFIALSEQRQPEPAAAISSMGTRSQADVRPKPGAGTKKVGKQSVGVKNAGKKPDSGTKKATATAQAPVNVNDSKSTEKSTAKTESSSDEEPDEKDTIPEAAKPFSGWDPVPYQKPFGDWQPVKVEEKKKTNDFAYLPHNQWVNEASNYGGTDQSISAVEEEEEPKVKITFSERTAPLISGTSGTSSVSCTFKKRKAPVTGRNIRNRDD